MLKSIFWLSLFAAPLLAQPIGFDSLAKRNGPVTLQIYINSTIFPDSEALKLVKLSIDDPLGTVPTPLPLATSNDTAQHHTFTRVVEDVSLPKTVDAALMANITLTAGEGMRNFTSRGLGGLGEGMDWNVSLSALSHAYCETDHFSAISP
jgi:hypothetical protein